MLRDLPHSHDPRVLAGYDLADDAGIFRLRDDLALVQTVDFFTPIVDDPYTFGQIAAANSLSDIYAMGGTPLTALNITVFPAKTIGTDLLHDILRGGAERALKAGVAIIGGHTVEGPEPMYGLACTGTIDPNRLVKPSGGQIGDEIILTKPVGTGIVATALKASRAEAGDVDAAVEWMTRLNGAASEVMMDIGPHAATDVTGFGLLGHLSQLAQASGVGAEVQAASVPLLPGAFDYARRGFVPAGGISNQEFFSDQISFSSGVDENTQVLMHDPQTSGGLLIAVKPQVVDAILSALDNRGEQGWRIGRLTDARPGSVSVK